MIGWTKDQVKNGLPFIYVLVAIFALRWTFIEPYVVPTGSMEPTLKTGDRLWALKCAYDVRLPFTEYVLFRTGAVKRGDVFLFRSPKEPEITFVKRVVGVPGDKLKLENGMLSVNGQQLHRELFPSRDILYDIDAAPDKSLFLENLLGVPHYVIQDHRNDVFSSHPFEDPYHFRSMSEVTIPEGHYFAMGDNRDGSSDSRSWGLVPEANLKGKAMFIWFSAWDRANTEVPRTPPSLPRQLLQIVLDFFAFCYHYVTGDAYFRPERIGTPIR